MGRGVGKRVNVVGKKNSLKRKKNRTESCKIHETKIFAYAPVVKCAKRKTSVQLFLSSTKCEH